MALIHNVINLSASGEVLSFDAPPALDRQMGSAYNVNSIIGIVENSTVATDWRIFLLNPDDSVKEELPRQDILVGGSYNESYQDGQRRTLSFSLDNSDGKYTPSINRLWFGSRFRLDMGLVLLDGTTMWFQKGVFVITSLSVTRSVAGQEAVSIEAGDKWSLFDGKTGTLDDTYEIPVNSDIRQIVTNICRHADESGVPFDSQPVLFSGSLTYTKTQAKISKSAGESYANILLELATQASAEIFYNANGQLVLIPTEETVNDVDKPLLYHYSEDSGNLGDVDLSFDMSNVLNKVVVIGSTSSGGYYRAVKVNSDPDSPTSVQRIGARMGSVVSDSNITTDYLADERATYELRQQLLFKTAVSLSVPLNPLLEVNNMIDVTENFYGMKQQRFLIKSVSAEIGYGGTMTIGISNVKNLGFITNPKDGYRNL